MYGKKSPQKWVWVVFLYMFKSCDSKILASRVTDAKRLCRSSIAFHVVRCLLASGSDTVFMKN